MGGEEEKDGGESGGGGGGKTASLRVSSCLSQGLGFLSLLLNFSFFFFSHKLTPTPTHTRKQVLMCAPPSPTLGHLCLDRAQEFQKSSLRCAEVREKQNTTALALTHSQLTPARKHQPRSHVTPFPHRLSRTSRQRHRSVSVCACVPGRNHSNGAGPKHTSTCVTSL